ncbi:Hypothetical predicted protein, partial [Pelobates cultripes]
EIDTLKTEKLKLQRHRETEQPQTEKQELQSKRHGTSRDRKREPPETEKQNHQR